MPRPKLDHDAQPAPQKLTCMHKQTVLHSRSKVVVHQTPTQTTDPFIRAHMHGARATHDLTSPARLSSPGQAANEIKARFVHREHSARRPRSGQYGALHARSTAPKQSSTQRNAATAPSRPRAARARQVEA